MYPMAVILQYKIQYNTQKHKITHTHSKQYTTQKLQTQEHKITNTMHQRKQEYKAIWYKKYPYVQLS
jgi:hypothetical protein